MMGAYNVYYGHRAFSPTVHTYIRTNVYRGPREVVGGPGARREVNGNFNNQPRREEARPVNNFNEPRRESAPRQEAPRQQAAPRQEMPHNNGGGRPGGGGGGGRRR